MKSRLEDLLATADRQLAAGSYDAAIDNYRTALGEPGAGASRVAEKLAGACRVRGIVPPTPETPAPAPVEAPVVAAPTEQMVEATVEPPPAQQAIEPPSFQLLEDNAALQASRRDEYPYVEVKPISILNPTLPPETPGDKIVEAIVSVIEFFS